MNLKFIIHSKYVLSELQLNMDLLIVIIHMYVTEKDKL